MVFRISKQRILGIIFVLGFLSVIWMLIRSNETKDFQNYFKPRLKSHSFCGRDYENSSFQSDKEPPFETYKKYPRVLIISKTTYSSAFVSVSQLLDANRIKYKVSIAGKNLPDLIKISRGTAKYGVVLFEDIRFYMRMDSWNRELLDKYCHKFKVGILAFVPWNSKPGENLYFADGVSLEIRKWRELKNPYVNINSSVPRLVKAGKIWYESLSGNNWVTLMPKKPGPFIPVLTAVKNEADEKALILQDTGSTDGISKVLIGGGLSHWLNKLLFLDAIHWLSNDLIRISMKRYVLIDIDDVFVGRNRMTPDDVDALIKSQSKIAKMVPGFKYNLGFSGYYYHLEESTQVEKMGDDELLKNKDKFWWFPHMWKHRQPHKFGNVSELIERMYMNKEFAEKHDLPVCHHYSVAPHHSGVYPVHEHLYDAWKAVWDIRVTSTEEYPHLRPARFRRGFVYKDIKVLPRQTCGLFTKNLYYDKYPKGSEVLERSIRGGELFQTIVFNPVSVFMTHMPNYGFDRLAPYTFESVFSLLKCWTNLDIQTINPELLGDIYFQKFPEEKAAIWGNPCNDRRHKEIWSESKSCRRLPNFLVIGPQKTGTTALYSFLKMHPSIRSNYPHDKTYEELQFFSGNQYPNGIDWYMEYFPINVNNRSILFEKSATYFDGELAPLRAHSLLPHAKLIAIIISPVKRAYSWYHHARAHKDSTALSFSFNEVISAGLQSSKALKSLRARCLDPGKYAAHLEKWLSFYNSQRLLIIDGEELKYDPVSVMNRIQHFLDVKPFVDYKKKLRYDDKKGFYCQVNNQNRTKCLGKGKGRQYPPMTEESQQYLREYFRLYNEALVKLLKRLGYSIPDWLEDDLKDGSKKSSIRSLTNNNDENDEDEMTS